MCTLSVGHYSELCATPVMKKLPNCSTRKDLSIATYSQSVPLESLKKGQKTCKDCSKRLPTEQPYTKILSKVVLICSVKS